MRQPIPYKYMCPIGHSLMVDPVVASDGRHYERKHIEKWLESHNTSPWTNLPLENKGLKLDEKLKKEIINEKFSQFLNEKSEQLKASIEASILENRIKMIDEISKSLLTTDDNRLCSQYELPVYIIKAFKNHSNTVEYLFLLENDLDFKHNFSSFISNFNLSINEPNEKLIEFLEKIDINFFKLFCENIKKITQVVNFEINQLLDLDKKLIMVFIRICNEDTLSSIQQKYTSIGLSFETLNSWESDDDSINLLHDFFELAFYPFPFDTFRQEKITLKQLQLLKSFDFDFREKILKTNFFEFQHLFLKKFAGISWNKWADLWIKEKGDSVEDKIFDTILKESKKFSTFVANIRKEWFKYDLESQSNNMEVESDEDKASENIVDRKGTLNKGTLANQHKRIIPQSLNEIFDQTVSIHMLWKLYKNLGYKEYNKLFINDEKKALIHGWLISGQITPKQIIEMFSDQKYKEENPDYITQYGLEGLKRRLDYYRWDQGKFSYDKTNELFAKLLQKLVTTNNNEIVKELSRTKQGMRIRLKDKDDYAKLKIFFNNQETYNQLTSLSFNADKQDISINYGQVSDFFKKITQCIDQRALVNRFINEKKDNHVPHMDIHKTKPQVTLSMIQEEADSTLSTSLAENKIVDKMIPKNVVHFQTKSTQCKPFWTVVLGLSIIGLSIYFGFVKNMTKLSHYLGGTGIAITFIMTGVLLYCLFRKSNGSSNESNLDEQLYADNHQRIETLQDFEITTDNNKLTGNNPNNQPVR